MDMNMIYGTLIVLMILATSGLILLLKAKGIISNTAKADKVLKDAEKVAKVLSLIIKRFVDDGHKELIDKVESVIETTLNYAQEMVISGNRDLVSQQTLMAYAMEICQEMGLQISDNDVELIKEMVSVVYMFIVEE